MSANQATTAPQAKRAEDAYFECIRELSLAARDRIESDYPPITEKDGPKLMRAKELFEEWQGLQLTFKSRRKAT